MTTPQPVTKTAPQAVKPKSTPSIGHNSGGSVTGAEVLQYIERYERLAEEKKDLGTDMAEVMAEAKNRGFDTGILKALVKLRAMDDQKKTEFNALLELYGNAIGINPFS